jgi:S1-C subfamily serine protease
VGDLVLAIGAPEGLEQTVTMGIISAKGRTTGRGAYESFLQTDAAVNHGNSGGPLVNMKGEIVGVTSAIVSRTGVNEGIGLAVPSNMAKNIMKQLIETGKVVRGFLGVAIQDNTPELAHSFSPPLPTTHGAVVLSVVAESPAKAAGLKEDDVIVEVDGQTVLNANELRNRIADVPPGQEVNLTILREGKKTDVTVKVGEQPADMNKAGGAAEKQAEGKKYGLQVSDMTKDMAEQLGYDIAQKGVVITDVDPDSDAADKGLRAGWLIDRVNDKDVSNVHDFLAAVGEAKEKPVRLHVLLPKNAGKRYFVISPK